MTRDEKMVMFILFLHVNMKANMKDEYNLTIDMNHYDSFIGRISKHYDFTIISHNPFTPQVLTLQTNFGFIKESEVEMSHDWIHLNLVINTFELLCSITVIFNYGTMRDVLKCVIGELMDIQNKIIEEKMVELL